ncbi:hypothetical protein [Streptomyces sp. NPDC056937]|uniref:hypothetical protein n=1 Tax=Streptomyces sp. NPDC056937 TaxID=3345969 RepID=UPI00363F774B
MLERAPSGGQELEGQIAVAGNLDVAGPGHTVLEHLGRRHPQPRKPRIDQRRVRPAMVDRRTPLPDDLLQLVQVVGVEIGGRRYRGPGLPSPGSKSPYAWRGKDDHWPFQVNPDDITTIYFRDRSRVWRELRWEHAPEMPMPLSEEALAFARKLAVRKYRYPDDRLAVADLLERWNAGLGSTPAERLMALRLSREQAIEFPEVGTQPVADLPSVRRALGGAVQQPQAEPEEIGNVEAGDDDAADFEDPAELEDLDLIDEDDFYATALKDVNE